MTTIERAAINVARAIPRGVLTCWGEGVVAIPVAEAKALLNAVDAPGKGIRVWCCGCGVLLSDGIEVETRERCETCAERRAR